MGLQWATDWYIVLSEGTPMGLPLDFRMPSTVLVVSWVPHAFIGLVHAPLVGFPWDGSAAMAVAHGSRMGVP